MPLGEGHRVASLRGGQRCALRGPIRGTLAALAGGLARDPDLALRLQVGGLLAILIVRAVPSCSASTAEAGGIRCRFRVASGKLQAARLPCNAC
ncbi:hypothetical protein GCM10009746_04430 [Microbacterium paludicola]